MDDLRTHIKIESEHLDAVGVSDAGLYRDENQDAIYIDRDVRFALLADGMGGHDRGKEAGQVIIDILAGCFQPEKIACELRDITAVEGVPAEVNGLFALIDRGIRKANEALYRKNIEEGIERSMGATLVGLIFSKGDCVTWFHVGDSRLYRLRDNTLTLLTEDHSAYAEWLKHGSIGEAPVRSIVTRAIGPREGVIPNISWERARRGDTYLLCSDGLSDMVPDREISRILVESSSVNGMAVSLLNETLDAGGYDNVSIIVCKLK
ncbi:MAG: serine/threonine-protein phosphatase [Deltaproteobacteria bacterium]|nr:serine/threonine-protein phosphatase [Deltaproteobacteria bacterium]